MKVIPVLDLKNGLVVHAKQGQRAQYQPMRSALSASADVFKVIEAFLGLYPFDTFYMADLDAIMGAGTQERLIARVQTAFPTVIFWLDRGFRQAPENTTKHWPVLGTESYGNGQLDTLAHFNRRFVLSLDFTASAPVVNSRLFQDSRLWPEQLILMTLARVGSNRGPDFTKLRHYRQKHSDKTIIAAGGIRHAEDLTALSLLGIERALVSSSLHSGAISAHDLEALSN